MSNSFWKGLYRFTLPPAVVYLCHTTDVNQLHFLNLRSYKRILLIIQAQHFSQYFSQFSFAKGQFLASKIDIFMNTIVTDTQMLQLLGKQRN